MPRESICRALVQGCCPTLSTCESQPVANPSRYAHSSRHRTCKLPRIKSRRNPSKGPFWLQLRADRNEAEEQRHHRRETDGRERDHTHVASPKSTTGTHGALTRSLCLPVALHPKSKHSTYKEGAAHTYDIKLFDYGEHALVTSESLSV